MTWTMTWEEKLQAIQALGDACLRMRAPGNWYVSGTTEIANNGMLESRFGNGDSPQSAVMDHWRKLTELAPHEYVVIHAMNDRRQEVRWNGFMWAARPRQESNA